MGAMSEVSSAERPARVLWLAGPELHAVVGTPLEATGISLLLPLRLPQGDDALPDVVLLDADGRCAAELAALARAQPGLPDVPVLRAPEELAHLEGPALEAIVQILAGAIHALAAPRRASTVEQLLMRRYQSEAAARLRSELTELRMTRLAEFSAALSRSATQAEVAAVVLTQAIEALYATTGYVALRRGDDLEVVFQPDYPAPLVERFQRVPLTAGLPSADCVLDRRARVFASPEAVLACYPGLPSAAWFKAWVFLPLLADDHMVGTICLAYTEPTTFGEDERRYMELLAQQCALALERARLYEIERDARKAREEALAIAAHDLRTPLSSISLSAGLLARSLDENVKNKGRVIQRAAEQAADLLRDLLDAAVIEQARLRVEIAPSDGAALVRDLHDLFAPLAEAKRVTLLAGCSGDVGRVAIDRARMHQALSNLLGNALKFTPPDGTIEVHLGAHDGLLRFTVRDTGPGIDPEGVPRLFDRYWQARATNRAGVGLGLYIVKGIVEAHGGSVQVSTAPGAGTTFVLSMADEGRGRERADAG
jgi:signal transduction histidine kinase